jgi:RNA processing factor Prp31
MLYNDVDNKKLLSQYVSICHRIDVFGDDLDDELEALQSEIERRMSFCNENPIVPMD